MQSLLIIQERSYSSATYFGKTIVSEHLEKKESLSCSVALNALNKINGKLKFLYRKNKFLTPTLRRVLCDALIQSHFDCTCSAWFSNLNKKLKIQIT